MIGPLPRLHRWTLLLIGTVAGAALGAWVSKLAVGQSDYACTDVLLGVCIGPALNVLPIIAGIALGLLSTLILIYHPEDTRRAISRDDDHGPGGRAPL